MRGASATVSEERDGAEVLHSPVQGKVKLQKEGSVHGCEEASFPAESLGPWGLRCSRSGSPRALSFRAVSLLKEPSATCLEGSVAPPEAALCPGELATHGKLRGSVQLEGAAQNKYMEFSFHLFRLQKIHTHSLIDSQWAMTQGTQSGTLGPPREGGCSGREF